MPAAKIVRFLYNDVFPVMTTCAAPIPVSRRYLWGQHMSQATAAKTDPYELQSIKRSDPPSGFEGSDWYRYKIIQGENTILGYRSGNRQSVTKAVEGIVAQLNERRSGKRGRVHFIPTPKKKKTS